MMSRLPQGRESGSCPPEDHNAASEHVIDSRDPQNDGLDNVRIDGDDIVTAEDHEGEHPQIYAHQEQQIVPIHPPSTSVTSNNNTNITEAQDYSTSSSYQPSHLHPLIIPIPTSFDSLGPILDGHRDNVINDGIYPMRDGGTTQQEENDGSDNITLGWDEYNSSPAQFVEHIIDAAIAVLDLPPNTDPSFLRIDNSRQQGPGIPLIRMLPETSLLNLLQYNIHRPHLQDPITSTTTTTTTDPITTTASNSSSTSVLNDRPLEPEEEEEENEIGE
jgi:hypothetical protein